MPTSSESVLQDSSQRSGRKPPLVSGLPIRDGRIRDVTGESADREEGRAETTGAGATGRGCGIQAQQHLWTSRALEQGSGRPSAPGGCWSWRAQGQGPELLLRLNRALSLLEHCAELGPCLRRFSRRLPASRVNQVPCSRWAVCIRAESLQSCLTLCDPMEPTRLHLCSRDSPGENTRVGCRALLQGIFPTQGSNPCLPRLLHC